MSYLENNWVRIIVSLFGGGAISEIIHISTGDPNRPMTTNPSILYAILVYIVLSIIVKRNKNKI
jgi:hypothetical protein